MDALTNSIEGLYQAFADIPSPRRIDGCPCCIDDKQVDVLLSTPLRELTSDALSSYAFSAFLTVGDVSDYLYFLPRIIEISIRDNMWTTDLEVTGRAINASGYDAWSEAHRHALNAVFTSYLEHLVETESYWDIDGLMCAVARIGINVAPYLTIIERDPRAILGYWEVNSGTLSQGKLRNAFWEPSDPGHDEIVEWFHSDSVSRLSSDAYGYRT